MAVIIYITSVNPISHNFHNFYNVTRKIDLKIINITSLIREQVRLNLSALWRKNNLILWVRTAK